MLLHLFLIVAISSAVPVIADGDPSTLRILPFAYFCNSTSVRRTYLPNSTFGANLAKLSASFPANASAFGGFLKDSIGAAPDTVYALALCRGDTDVADCAACLSMAFQEVQSLCNRSRDNALGPPTYDRILVCPEMPSPVFFSWTPPPAPAPFATAGCTGAPRRADLRRGGGDSDAVRTDGSVARPAARIDSLAAGKGKAKSSPVSLEPVRAGFREIRRDGSEDATKPPVAVEPMGNSGCFGDTKNERPPPLVYWLVLVDVSGPSGVSHLGHRCQMRFFDQDFTAGTGNNPEAAVWNIDNMTEPMFPGWDPNNEENVAFVKATVLTFLSETAKVAAYKSNRFATAIMDIGGAFPTLYSTAQCTPDLSPDDCLACLTEVVQQTPQFFSGRQGGRIHGVRCSISPGASVTALDARGGDGPRCLGTSVGLATARGSAGRRRRAVPPDGDGAALRQGGMDAAAEKWRGGG
ncbi:hypothetical protein EJB05_15805, partial [Eragrostis curvula]